MVRAVPALSTNVHSLRRHARARPAVAAPALAGAIGGRCSAANLLTSATISSTGLQCRTCGPTASRPPGSGGAGETWRQSARRAVPNTWRGTNAPVPTLRRRHRQRRGRLGRCIRALGTRLGHPLPADTRIGGHAHNHYIDRGDGSVVGVDSAFLVHNDRTYPTLCRLFAELGIATRETDLSMSVPPSAVTR
jgi:hypothetical protein